MAFIKSREVQGVEKNILYIIIDQTTSPPNAAKWNRQEVNVAEAGAADERRARAIAETSLSEALRRLEETRSMLQESLVNGPAVTLAALLEEKTEVEAMAKVQHLRRTGVGRNVV